MFSGSRKRFHWQGWRFRSRKRVAAGVDWEIDWEIDKIAREQAGGVAGRALTCDVTALVDECGSSLGHGDGGNSDGEVEETHFWRRCSIEEIVWQKRRVSGQGILIRPDTNGMGTLRLPFFFSREVKKLDVEMKNGVEIWSVIYCTEKKLRSSTIFWYCAWWPLPLRYQGEGARMPRGTIDSYRWMQGRFVKNSEDKSERSIRKARVRFERRSIEGCLALRKTLRKRGSRKEPPNLGHLDRVPHTRMYKHTPPPNGWWWLLIFEQIS